MQRFENLLGAVAADETAILLLDQLVSVAQNHFSVCSRGESKLRIARLRLDCQALQTLTEETEQRRAASLDGLVFSARIFWRYTFEKFGMRSPYTSNDHQEVESWAGELLISLFAERKR